MANIQSGAGSTLLTIDPANNGARAALYDQNGNPLARADGSAAAATDRFLPIAGLNDGNFRAVRVDRMGSLGTGRFMLNAAYQLTSSATLPPAWLNPATTFTTTHSQSSGTLLNAGATGAINCHASLTSIAAIGRNQKAPTFFRTRSRLQKGATNGQSDMGLSSTQAPASNVIPNGFIFLFGLDGTLKPMVMMASAAVCVGVDFAGLINSASFYVWDIVVDDDSATFTVQDASTGLIVNEQTLRINAGDPRFGMSLYFHGHCRAWVGPGGANIGAATQLAVADITIGTLDIESNKPWAHTMASIMQGGLVNPNSGLGPISNYANSIAPVSAVLSNTAAGYTTLGGQFQFAAIAGSEVDYAIFAYTAPPGFKFVCTDISIDTVNTGAANATSATWLQWFAAADSLGVTLAANTFRIPLGNQTFAIADPIAKQANPVVRTFQTPLTTNAGRILHVGFKIPIAAATNLQIIRGTVAIGGYFE